MTHSSLSRFFESCALCVSAVAMVFTLTIAVKLGVIFASEWPGLRPKPAQQLEVATAAPKTSKAARRPAKKRQPASAVNTVVAPKPVPTAASSLGAADTSSAER